MQKAIFIRKALSVKDYFAKARMWQIDSESYVVEKVVKLDKNEYICLVNDFMKYRNWITENIPNMKKENGVWHCIMAKCEGEKYALLIESEGYDYARYTAVIEVENEKNQNKNLL